MHPDTIGAGTPALLLPALSSISAKSEMHPLAHLLADRFQCIIPDWPGFGGQTPTKPLTPNTIRNHLDTLIAGLDQPAIGIGAGHAATYLAEAAKNHPDAFTRLILIAPTWRGPLPTMLGDHRRPVANAFRTMLEAPAIGPALYRLNVSRPVLAAMMRGHVYANRNYVTPETIAAKLAITRRPSARFATAAFISGGLDPVISRAAFLALFGPPLPPTLLLRPEGAPPKSAAEMDALTQTGLVTAATVPGALAAHEEHPDHIATAMTAFLNGGSHHPTPLLEGR